MSVMAAQQSGSPGGTLSAPLSVRVTDVNGAGVAGVTVNFNVTGGGGSLADNNPTSNADGFATTGTWTLGPAQGNNVVVATTPDLPGTSVTFHATAGPHLREDRGRGGYGGSAGQHLVADPPSVLSPIQ